jgi:hypothetical protein
MEFARVPIARKLWHVMRESGVRGWALEKWLREFGHWDKEE